VDAHKPITSPYTFTEDVLPILRDRCTACHVAGGVAPMALTTPEEAIPWGESIRLELIAGHMPPWGAISNGARLRHAEGLSARELNVLLTWVTGGTPVNAPAPAALPPAAPTWSLGAPDAIVPTPDVTVAAEETDVTREFVLPLGAHAGRPLRAVDLRPGTPALVRSARVSIKSATVPGDVERLVALWVPGDTPVALPSGIAYDVPADAELVVRVRYKKTWQHERKVMSDRSELGLYFADAGAETVRTVAINAPAAKAAASGAADGIVSSQVVKAAMRLLSLHPAAASAGATVTLDALQPSGARQRLIEFAPRPGWDRRYAFEAPVDLPAGTQLSVAASWDDGRPASASSDLLVLDVVSSGRR
jgi:hypothetical protein